MNVQYQTSQRLLLGYRLDRLGVESRPFGQCRFLGTPRGLGLATATTSATSTACRAMAYQEGERAKKIENPTMRGPLEVNSKRYAAPAENLEAARNRTDAARPHSRPT